ncbi:unnamed protein product [Effrenium voratum]|nr:unnamed protein product [Effrenium voratum]
MQTYASGPARPPSTVRPLPPSTVRPSSQTRPPPPQTIGPARTGPRPIASSRLRPAGADTLNWHANRQLHPHASPRRTGLSAEEQLEEQLALEAECGGVELRGGYVPAEVLNEHPSELASFDRRMWAKDPFYGWRTQEQDAVPKSPPLRAPHPLQAEAPVSVPTAAAPAPTWMEWLTGAPPPEPEPDVPVAPVPLPSARSLAWREEPSIVTAESLSWGRTPPEARALWEPGQEPIAQHAFERSSEPREEVGSFREAADLGPLPQEQPVKKKDKKDKKEKESGCVLA